MPGRGERESAGAGAEGRGQAAYARELDPRAPPVTLRPPRLRSLAWSWARARWRAACGRATSCTSSTWARTSSTSSGPPTPMPATPVQPGAPGEGDLRPLTCVVLCPQRGRGRQGRPASRRGPELPGGKSRRRMKGEAGTGQGKPSLGPGLRPRCPPLPRRPVPVGGCRAAQLGRAGQVYHFQPHRRRGPRAGQRGSLGRAAPLGPAALLSRGPGRSPQRPPEAPGHPVSATLVSLESPTAGGGQRSERTLCLDRIGALGEMSRCHLGVYVTRLCCA